MATIFDCCEPIQPSGDTGNPLDPVYCIADLSLPMPVPSFPGARYIVYNVATPHPSWINLPAFPIPVQDGDIIERDFQNLNWLLAYDISNNPINRPLVHVECKGFYYWWNGTEWKEISPTAFSGLVWRDDYCSILDSTTSFTLSHISQNPDRSVLKVNGVVVNYGSEYIINGTTLTWLNLNYELGPEDSMQILYS